MIAKDYKRLHKIAIFHSPSTDRWTHEQWIKLKEDQINIIIERVIAQISAVSNFKK